MNVKHKYISIFITCFVGLFLLVSCSDEDIAAIKLVAHLKKYDQAKDVMITRNYLSQNPIARDEWEILFMMEEADKFTQNEIDYLSSNRKLIIAENAARAARQSAIDLNPLRKDQAALGDFCHQIPKGGMLHVHPYGILSRSVIVEILERFNPTIDPEYFITTVENLGQQLYDHEIDLLHTLPKSTEFLSYTPDQQKTFIDMFFLPKEPVAHDFERFDSIFAFVIWMIEDDNQDEKLKIVFLDYLQKAASEGLTYIEFTNGFPANHGTIEKLKNWSDFFLKETGVTVRWNIGQLRFLPAEYNAEFIKSWNTLLTEYPSEEIVGIDLYANEKGNSALEKAQNAYGYLNGYNLENPDHPLEMTMHAGELGDVRNVRDAMLMGVSRVGHGVLLRDDWITLEYARLLKLGVEMNISSNHQLKVHDLNSGPHPFLDFLRLGLQVSISTDNDAIFGTSVSNECVVAVRSTDISYNELKTLYLNSIKTSFADKAKKQELLRNLERDLILFEQKYLAAH